MTEVLLTTTDTELQRVAEEVIGNAKRKNGTYAHFFCCLVISIRGRCTKWWLWLVHLEQEVAIFFIVLYRVKDNYY